MSLTEKIQRMLFEDTWNKYGSEYMSHPYEQEDFEPTIQPELPIAASAQANMQLTDTAPPVDDDAYVPVNNKELSSALAALALKVPDRYVENLFRQVRKAVQAVEALGDEQLPDAEVESAATIDVEDVQLEERLNVFLKHVLTEVSDEEEFEKFRHGDREEAPDDYYNVPDDEKLPDSIQGKYLAQYWRERPGKDPEKFKGSGESTMVTATGRLLQNVVRPLMDVPKDQLADAAEYLRLQFKMLARDLEDIDIPREAPRTFSGMYLKKLVPKLSEDQLGGNFLQTVVKDFKRRNKKWLQDLRDSAIEEVGSEIAARAKLKATLEKEAPKQAALMDELL
jgi:hypothetical protein